MTKRVPREISRRSFLQGAVASAAVLPTLHPRKALNRRSPFLRNPNAIRKAIVIGMDGMDPVLMKHMMDRGELPTFKKLSERGVFSKLQTTLPPQSPVAWASFITGSDPGVHSIFDFVHRIPETLTPYLSTSRTMEAAKTFRVGDWTIPLSSAEVRLMRKGVALWDALADAGIPSTVIQIPSNYPTHSDSNLVHSISGMGTPDLLGSYGTFTMFSDKPAPKQASHKEGRWVSVTLQDNIVETSLLGPSNNFKVPSQPVGIAMRIERDSQEKILRLSIGGEKIVLQEGEWSRWIPVAFPMIPFVSTSYGMVRFYAKEIHPGFVLYCSPINADPLNPSLPISSPPEYASELAEQTDRFYTQGFPADTKALSAGAFTSDEFYKQSRLVFDESILNFEKTFSQFNEGLFFFYFSSLDQSSHMLWRMMNPQHPLYEKDAPPEVKSAIPGYYKEMDFVLSRVLEKEDGQTLVIAMSDHGFANFTREFNVSSWLVEQGFTRLSSDDALGNLNASPYQEVDWLESQAYVCGINGIFINRKGRDKYGWMSDSESQKTIDDIIARLDKVHDPKTGAKIVVKAYDAHKSYTTPDPRIVPDIIIGYADGFRISDEAVLGKFPKSTVTDRTDLWSADHCVDPSVVPGMFVSNRKLTDEKPGIWDMAPSILNAFGVSIPKEMTGRSVIKV